MKNPAIILFLILFSLTAFGQKPKKSKNPAKTKSSAAKTTEIVKENIGSEKEEFAKAVALVNPSERIKALQKFIENFPKSEEKTHAAELITSARAEIADEKLRLSETENGIEMFKKAIEDAPAPVSEKLFTEIILQIPTNLFFRNEHAAAFDAAKMIEAKIDGNANQLLGLATFYLGIENASEAKRLAGKAIELNPNLPAAYQTLGLANRLDFQLDEAANAYTKALELDQNSVVSKRSLAEMKRAVGKPDEAEALYREILATNENDAAAQTGLILALFDADKRAEAEAEMAKSLEANPKNLFLLVGASYWYAAHGDGDKSVELANKAVDLEPRYTWAHIALARGLMRQKKPLDAERVLLAARQYGNFPTLDYELAAVRLEAGFFREAANALKNTFAVKENLVETKLGGRVPKQSKNFLELLANERRASIFEPLAADDPENAEKLKDLLVFSQKLDAADADKAEISTAADEFVKGDDNMKLHRQLFAANRLLEKRTATDKALELAKSAVGGVNAALNVPTPAAAVLADELYESRTLAISRNELVIVPDIPRDTLSKILRGRIEETTGWALSQQEKPEEAAVRFKRALSVLPEKSAWWRDSMWRLGAALQNNGKQKEALDAYIKSYASGAPDAAKRIIIESLYQQVNGSLDGLDEKIGAKPSDITTAAFTVKSEQTETTAETKKIESNGKNSSTIVEISSSPEIKIEQIDEKESETPLKKVEEQTEKPSNIEPNEIEKNKIDDKIEINKKVEKSETVVTQETEKPPPQKISENQNEEKENEKEKSKDVKTENVEASPSPTPDLQPPNEDSPTEKTTPEATAEEKNNSMIETSLPPETAENSKKEIPPDKAAPQEKTKPKVEVKLTEDLPAKPAETAKNQNSETNQKSIFEPVIISIPKSPAAKKPKSETAKVDEKTSETKSSSSENNKNETEKPNEPAAKKNEEKPVLGETRQRVVVEQKIADEPQCKIKTSQDEISILGGGGSLGIILNLENGGNLKEIRASSNKPKDVEVSLEPEIGASENLAFFIIKSVSGNKGIYTVTFESPCGKKNVTVKVR